MSSKYKDLNAIYRRKGGGIIYVGNEKASKTHKILKDNGIKGIINCTQGEYTLENHFPRQINYCMFPIAEWEDHVDKTDTSVLLFFGRVFHFIEEHLKKGENVLVHCLAGAHRAGNTGIACLMHFSKMNIIDAIAAAKMFRPCIDPKVGTLPRLMQRFSIAQLRGNTDSRFKNMVEGKINRAVSQDSDDGSSIGILRLSSFGSEHDNHQSHALTGSQSSYPGPNSVGYEGKHMSEARALMERKSRARRRRHSIT
jgi:hypothetical protein